MARLGEFYACRSRAALAHGAGDDEAAVEQMRSALAIYRDLAETDASHRKPFRVLAGRAAVVGNWTDTLAALEAELTDAESGVFRRGTSTYLVHEVAGCW
jgi:hypothetical protein